MVASELKNVTQKTGRMTQEERRARSDRRLVRAAIKLISKQGAVGTSLAQIGVEAGYSRGLPAERFGSKVKLLETLLDRIDEGFTVRLKHHVAGKTAIDALAARIDAHLDGIINYPDDAKAFYHLFVESLTLIPEIQPRIQALEMSYRKGFQAVIEDGQSTGEIRADIDAGHYAMLILGTQRGVILQALMTGRTDELIKLKEVLLDLYRTALKA